MDPNTLICPYNQSHVIAKERMQFHLTKCRKNYLLDDKVRCSFDATHIVNSPEIEYHEKYCPARRVLDDFVYDIGDTSCLARQLLPVSQSAMPDSNEDWETEDTNVNVLETLQEQASTKPILRSKIGAQRAERKQFRTEERVRHRDNNRKDMPGPSEKSVPKQTPNVDYATSLIGRGRGQISQPTQGLKNTNKVLVAEPLTVGNDSYKDQSYSTVASRAKNSEERKMTSNVTNDNNKPKILNHFTYPKTEEGFCSLPIPGTSGRGKRRTE